MKNDFVCTIPDAPLAAVQPSRLAVQTSRKWQDRKVLRVRFMDGDPKLHKYVADLITGPRGWNAACGMQFVFGDDPAAEIHISFQPGASWSYLGTDAKWIPADTPTMQLGVRVEDAGPHIDRPINHEFGHALGFVHEHKNPLAGDPNVEAVYRYYRERGWTDAQTRAQVLDREDETDVQAVSLDRRSVMAYVMPGDLWQDGQAWESSAYPTYWDAYAAETWYGPPPVRYTSVILPFVARS